jgi:alcohol dehydrogenase class IV
MRFEFATATKILFGQGTFREIGPAFAESGQRALVVTGGHPDRAEPLRRILCDNGLAEWTWRIPGEPKIEAVVNGAKFVREHRLDLVIGFGGGSAIDAGKAIAALAANDGDIFDYLEIIGRAEPLDCRPLPFIAIPTTAGTGAEVTRNAVLTSPAHGVKASLRSPLLLPKLAVVDPELTLGLPAALTASTGLDALTQLIEPFVACRANPLTDALCREGIPRVARSLGRACEHPDDLAAREDMALASLFSGLALANAGLGAVHGFAAPIGGMFPAPHGAVCAALLPHAMAMNLRALRQRQPDSMAVRRFDEIARLLTGSASARADDGVTWVSALCAQLNIAPLGRHGITTADVPAVCEKAALSSSMKSNPLPLSPPELEEMLSRAL